MADESNPNPNAGTGAGAGGQAGGNVNVQNGAPQAQAQFATTEETKFAHDVTQLDSSTAMTRGARAPSGPLGCTDGHATTN